MELMQNKLKVRKGKSSTNGDTYISELLKDNKRNNISNQIRPSHHCFQKEVYGNVHAVERTVQIICAEVEQVHAMQKDVDEFNVLKKSIILRRKWETFDDFETTVKTNDWYNVNKPHKS